MTTLGLDLMGVIGPSEAPLAITILGSGRFAPTLTALAGAIGVVLGALALVNRRARGGAGEPTDTERHEATAGLTLGVISLAIGALLLVTADGGPGTGNGVVASFLAVVLGPVAIALSGFSIRRGSAGDANPSVLD